MTAPSELREVVARLEKRAKLLERFKHLTRSSDPFDRALAERDQELAADIRAVMAALPALSGCGVGLYGYVPMPVNAAGDGPADPDETVRVDHTVWDLIDNSTVCVARDEETARQIARALSLLPGLSGGISSSSVDESAMRGTTASHPDSQHSAGGEG